MSYSSRVIAAVILAACKAAPYFQVHYPQHLSGALPARLPDHALNATNSNGKQSQHMAAASTCMHMYVGTAAKLHFPLFLKAARSRQKQQVQERQTIKCMPDAKSSSQHPTRAHTPTKHVQQTQALAHCH
jgi:hypothetical protein